MAESKFNLLKICFKESSIHGFPHIVAPGRHFSERIFWLAIICFSVLATINVCFDQYTRYIESPTVLSMETNYRNWEYRPAALTVCSNYTNEEIAIKIVKRYWKVDPGQPLFEYFYNYVITVATTRYFNFGAFKGYVGDKRLDVANMLDIAAEMKRGIPMPDKHYTPVITELGLCQSSSGLHYFQSPVKRNGSHQTTLERRATCRSMDVCKFSTTPSSVDADVLTIFIHNEDEVLTADETTYETLQGRMVLETIAEVGEVVAAQSLLLLPPKIRKCRFMTEPMSPYFDKYTIGLCKISCRIQNALELCGCVPFLYNVDAKPVCKPKGLFCLSQKHWFNVTCACPTLCEYQTLKKIYTSDLNFFQFNKMLSLSITFPKNRIKRNVLFSFNDLLVSFGGAAALFLGFSFLSGVELVYFCLEWACHVIRKCLMLLSQRKNNDLNTRMCR